jgi:hypothetical protein
MMIDVQGHDRLPIDDAEAEAYAARRQALHLAVVDLEGVLDELATDDEPDRERLVDAVRALHDAFQDHVREADAPDGLLAQILSDAPWFAARAEKLRDEHGGLVARADALVDDATADRAFGELLLEARQLAADVTRHRHAGTDLLMDAYLLDIPAGD